MATLIAKLRDAMFRGTHLYFEVNVIKTGTAKNNIS